MDPKTREAGILSPTSDILGHSPSFFFFKFLKMYCLCCFAQAFSHRSLKVLASHHSGEWARERSVVVALGLSSSAACGISLDQG